MKRDFPVGSVMSLPQVVENKALGIVEMRPWGWLVFVTWPDGSVAHYEPGQAELLAKIFDQEPVLAERLAPGLRELARQCRALNGEAKTA